MSDPRDFLEQRVYQGRRYTQQSPVMPDVWIRYGLAPERPVDLLMVPDWHHDTAVLTGALRERLAADGAAEPSAAARAYPSPALTHNQNVVVARLDFRRMVRCVLPLSRWWRESMAAAGLGPEPASATGDAAAGRAEAVRRALEEGTDSGYGADWVWFVRVAGLLAYLATEEGGKKVLGPVGTTSEGGLERDRRPDADVVASLQELDSKPGPLVAPMVALLEAWTPVDRDDPAPLYSVNRNRTTSASLYRSVASIKGDATRRLFRVDGQGIRWAVIDSGIDARHVAFRKRDEAGRPLPRAFDSVHSVRRRGRRRADAPNHTRVRATYDFTRARELLGADPDALPDMTPDHELVKAYPALADSKVRERLAAFLRTYDRRVTDWTGLEEFVRVPHTPAAYRPPRHPHGTHVAGIIAADWRATDVPEASGDHETPAGEAAADPPAEAPAGGASVAETSAPQPGQEFGPPPGGGDLSGVGPAVELYDLRVLNDRGQGNEFAIMSAMQFVRDLNNRKDFVAIHGANLSFSIDHDVANYACGRTPVCDEAERMVGAGIVVVAAAGNAGRARYLTSQGPLDDGFRTVSITDPGNAQEVITVGATHGSNAHTYGVSYFSSRGPTGDGRLKPDLVAPGEKILSTAPEQTDQRLDGTSMAAPHVSGAIALILARHPEFVGQPRRLKQIICDTATDLGRERYFQGAGLLDVLRALQSI